MVVLDLVGDEVHAVGTVHGELAIAEDGGVVLEEGLELALALVVLAYLEEESFDVGVVVVRPDDWNAICGGRRELVDDGVG